MKDILLKLGARLSAYDNALFLWHDKGNKLMGILASHVDDFVFAGSKYFHNKVIAELKQSLLVSVHSTGTFKYLGMTIKQYDDNVIEINQDPYIPSITMIEMSRQVVNRSDKLDTCEKENLKRLSGQMNWVTSHTRPDLSFETCVMSNPGKHPSVKMLHDANKAVKKLKSGSVSINFVSLGEPHLLEVVAYSDATYASLEDGSSQGAFVIFVRGHNEKMVPIAWQSKKLTRVTKSPLASEALALSEAADAALLVATMIKEIFRLGVIPHIQCYCDNKSLINNLVSSRIVSDRRLRVDIARIKEMVERNEINVHWIIGKNQLADALTKRGASTESLLNVLSKNEL